MAQSLRTSAVPGTHGECKGAYKPHSAGHLYHIGLPFALSMLPYQPSKTNGFCKSLNKGDEPPIYQGVEPSTDRNNFYEEKETGLPSATGTPTTAQLLPWRKQAARTFSSHSLGFDSLLGKKSPVDLEPLEALLKRPMSPQDVNDYLRNYLRNGYQFKKAVDVYVFLGLVSQACIHNPLWVPKAHQLLLDSLVTSNGGSGLRRLVDIIVWQPVSISAGRSATILSFQRAYVPLLSFLASDVVVKTTLQHQANAVYSALINNLQPFWVNLQSCMHLVMSQCSFKDSGATPCGDRISGVQLFMSLITVLYDCLCRFKKLQIEHPLITDIIYRLQDWIHAFIDCTRESPAAFDGEFEDMGSSQRDSVIKRLEEKLSRLVRIIERKSKRVSEVKGQITGRVSQGTPDEGSNFRLQLLYEGPGNHRPSGPRHDNDFADIVDISVPPTRKELMSDIEPHLPGNFDGAPHHLSQRSMERHMDIQSRLLREELIAPFRVAIKVIYADIVTESPSTQLAELQETKGGRYRACSDTQDNVMFNVYTGVSFSGIKMNGQGASIELQFDSPPGHARSPDRRTREIYCQEMLGRRLGKGGLIALFFENDLSIELGIIASTFQELKHSIISSNKFIKIRVEFLDPKFEVKVLRSLHLTSSPPEYQQMLLIESPVLYGSIRPFLEVLKAEPESVPLAKYIIEPFRPAADSVSPPEYARQPGFSFQLAPLFSPEAGVTDLPLDVLDPASVERSRVALKGSRLDESQASAVVDALTREVALIQGPPGTGKSYTGVELLRVLVRAAKPILMVALTNNALDHFLRSILDADITSKVVRVGFGCTDKRIAQYSLTKLEDEAEGLLPNSVLARYKYQLRGLSHRINVILDDVDDTNFPADAIMDHIEAKYPCHWFGFLNPPAWVNGLNELEEQKGDQDPISWALSDHSIYTFWLEGRDLEYLEMAWNDPIDSDQVQTRSPSPLPTDNRSQPPQNQYSNVLEDTDKSKSERSISLAASVTPIVGQSINTVQATSETPALMNTPDVPCSKGAELDRDPGPELPVPVVRWLIQSTAGELPNIPKGDHPAKELLLGYEIWEISHEERKSLHKQWTQEMKERKLPWLLEEYSDLQREFSEISKLYQEARHETRRQLLHNVDLIGCTTTGAAQLNSVLRALEPRILLVEEAGQVLEAHVLTSLVPSIEHLIMIGDPLQLRPNVENYSFSVDSKPGAAFYRFDISLMERLSSSRFPMSRIDVQRRMRPEISSLIRDTLYPALIDHNNVMCYPHVKGMAHDVFFLNHENPESDEQDDDPSKFNTYEAGMIKDLVLYLLKQGYSQDGDLAVLCAYAGQVALIRDVLSSEVMVLVGDGDKQKLALQGYNECAPKGGATEIKVTKRVRVKTVDNYQGEEAKIVILSLVRNAGPQSRHGSATIGFLKSTNRTNVALSRAKEGLYILGNVDQLRSSNSAMWKGVLDHLAENNLIGDAFPISCPQHPDTISYVKRPGQLSTLAPNGGCFRPCSAKLGCGHTCPHQCHSGNLEHERIACRRPCTIMSKGACLQEGLLSSLR